MSVIDETWTAYNNAIDAADGTGDRIGVMHVGPDCESRARLAAQAPRMARLLRALEWAGTSCNYERIPACPACDANENSPFGHAADCELAAVLRDAEVLP